VIQWHIETVSINKLKNHPKNPRQIDKQQLELLQNLIEKFGLIDKPIINKDYTIIGGHQRIRILKKMKVKEVECWIPESQLSDEDIDHLCIGLNLNQGSWDYEILANNFEVIDLLKYGFTEEQLLGASKEAERIANDLSDEDKCNKKCEMCGQKIKKKP
jgi:ParB-like chromosome segregation protein Spo0J